MLISITSSQVTAEKSQQVKGFLKTFLPRMTSVFAILTVVVIATAWFLSVVPAHASPTITFTVNTTADPSPGTNLCSVVCSLRYAVNSANATSGATISVPAGTYALTLGAISINNDMSIVGAGAISTTVDGGGTDSVFIVSSNIAVTLADMTLQRGFSPGYGGAIQDDGNLTLDGVTLFNNIANTAGGGVAAWNGGALTMMNSTAISNAATYGGGIAGVYTIDNIVISNSLIMSNTGGAGVGISSFGPLTVTNSTISNNVASSYGGGISALDGGALINSTVSGNTSHLDGGGIFIGVPSLFTPAVTFTVSSSTINNNADMSSSAGGLGIFGSSVPLTAILINSTISNNRAPNTGGGIYASAAHVELFNTTVYSNSANFGGGVYVLDNAAAHLENSIVAGNGAGTLGPDCYGTVNSQGYNLIQNTANCSFVSALGDITGTNPLLGALQNNGGSTLTHALLINSPAINAGNPAGCKDSNGTTLTMDQRGFPRPFGGRCDIGSFEYQSLFTRALYLPLIVR